MEVTVRRGLAFTFDIIAESAMAWAAHSAWAEIGLSSGQFAFRVRK
jgi:hypothetical protein